MPAVDRINPFNDKEVENRIIKTIALALSKCTKDDEDHFILMFQNKETAELAKEHMHQSDLNINSDIFTARSFQDDAPVGTYCIPLSSSKFAELGAFYTELSKGLDKQSATKTEDDAEDRSTLGL